MLILLAALSLRAQERVNVVHGELNESSGITRSGRSADVFWTHNDSGGKSVLYAFDLKGKVLGTLRLTGAKNRDWEDMAIGPGPKPKQPYLYVGDIGDNGRRRESISIYRVLEPAKLNPDGDKTAAVEKFEFTYPGTPHDAEAMFVHPKSGDLYIVTKTRRKEKPVVFKAAAPHKAGTSRELTKVRELDLPDDAVGSMLGRITGAAISPDGSRVVLCGYSISYEGVLPKNAKSFDEIFAQSWNPLNLGQRAQGEGATYAADGLTLIATSEGVPMAVFITRRELK